MLGGIGNLKTVLYNNFINKNYLLSWKNFRNIENEVNMSRTLWHEHINVMRNYPERGRHSGRERE